MPAETSNLYELAEAKFWSYHYTSEWFLKRGTILLLPLTHISIKIQFTEMQTATEIQLKTSHRFWAQ